MRWDWRCQDWLKYSSDVTQHPNVNTSTGVGRIGKPNVSSSHKTSTCENHCTWEEEEHGSGFHLSSQRTWSLGSPMFDVWCFCCPEQLNRWPCHWLTDWLRTLLIDIKKKQLKSEPKDLWPLRHLIRVMRRQDQANENLFNFVQLFSHCCSIFLLTF